MKTRPKIFTFMSVTLILIGLSIPVQIMWLYGHWIDEIEAVLTKIAPINWFVISSSLLCGALSWRASPWIKIVAPINVGIVLWNNWIVAKYALNFTPLTAASGALAFSALHGLWFHPQVRGILAEPSRRWWLTPPRRDLNLPIFIETHLEDPIKARTFDISESGAFVSFELERLQSSRGLRSLQPGRRIGLKLVINPINVIQCEAEIVRVVEANGRYPAGIGLRFVKFEHQARNEIESLVAA